MRTASKFIIPILCSFALLLALCQPLTASAASESEEVIVWTTEQTKLGSIPGAQGGNEGTLRRRSQI